MRKLKFANTNCESDEELAKKILKRDFEALGELFKRYERSFYNLAYRYTGDHYAADDLASEIFLRIYRYLPSFRIGGQFKPWAMKVASNTCLDFVRSAKVQRSKGTKLTRVDGETEIETEIEWEDKKVNIEKDYDKKEIEKRVQEELLKLPDKYRLALYFYFWEDLSYDEIAKIMGLPLNTVRTHIKRGKERLEKALDDIL